MLSRREKVLLALMPPLLIVCVQAFVLEPQLDLRIQAAETKLATKDPAAKPIDSATKLTDRAAKPTDPAVASESSNASVVVLHRDVSELEQAVAIAERRAPALRAKWTRPERRAQVVSDLARMFEERGARLRSSSAAPKNDVPEVPALDTLARTMHTLGGAEPEAWRFELSGGFKEILDVLTALCDQPSFVLPIALKVLPREHGGGLDVVLWAWI